MNIQIILREGSIPFTATIYSDNVIGHICIESNKVYLCQDVRDGSPCENKLGHNFSWYYNGNIDSEVTNLVVENSIPSEVTKGPIYQHGQGFAAYIKDKYIAGKISIDTDGCIYLCQDEIVGCEAQDLLGYKYSWSIGEGTEKYLKRNTVDHLVLLDPPSISEDLSYFKVKSMDVCKPIVTFPEKSETSLYKQYQVALKELSNIESISNISKQKNKISKLFNN